METVQDNQLSVIERSSEIIQSSGEVLQKNMAVSAKAVEIGNNILATIAQNNGQMTAELDDRCQKYLATCSARIKEMNEARKPITQLMDEIKKMFTEAEGKLDSKKTDVPAYRIQAFRNDYAKQVYEEQERKRKEAERTAAKAKEAIELKTSAESRLFSYFNNYLSDQKHRLQYEFNSITLETFDGKKTTIMSFPVAYPYEHFSRFDAALFSTLHSKDELQNIVLNVVSGKFDQYAQEYNQTLTAQRDELLQLLPSKKQELEAIAQADADEKARLMQQQRQREQEEKERMEAEAREKEAQQKIALEMSAAADNTLILFEKEAEISQATPAPEARQGYDITVTHQVGYVQIFQFWFEHEGKGQSLDKIEKTTIKQMVSFCEKHAHKNGTKIESPYIKYAESFKAVNRKA